MHILITGAGGMLGSKLARALAERGLATKLTLTDYIEPDMPENFEDAISIGGDLLTNGQVERLLADKPDVIYHLAAIVSGEAELDFDKGYSVNLDATRMLLETTRTHENYCPRFVFSSSLAVFGGALPDVIEDDQRLTPKSSYGTQKAMGELMVADYSRKGFVDGLSMRFPTVVVRPGKPNKAASSFYSSIIREPLNGEEAVLPVPRDVRHWFQSPRAAVENLVHAGTVDTTKVPADRAISLPGVSVTVDEMIDSLRSVAGSDAVSLIREEADELVQNVVMGWPKRFNPKTALAMGFKADADFGAIIAAYQADDLGSL